MSSLTAHDTPEIFDEYARALRQQGYADQTIRNRIRLLRLLGDPRTATRDDVLRVMDMAHKASSRRVYLNTLRAAYHDLRDLGIVDLDPTSGLRSPTPPRGVPRPLSTAEIHALLTLEGRHYDWTIMGLRAGLRSSEVTRVKPTDLRETDAGWVLDVVGKGGVRASIPAHDDVVAILQPLQPYDRPLWPIRPCHLSNGWRAAAESVGVHGRRFHDLRHTFASQLYAQTGDLYVTSRLLRHASIATTTIYAQPDEGRAFRAVSGL